MEVKRVTKSLFILPLYERVISDQGYWTNYTKCMELDGVGFFLKYNEPGQENDHDWIRRHAALRKECETTVEAKDLQSAINRFHNEWCGAKIGGEDEKAKAVWINRGKPILEIPPCRSYRLREQEGDVICGDPNEYGHAGCVFGQFDAPEGGCVGSRFYEAISKDIVDGHWIDKIQPETYMINEREYKLHSWRQIPLQEEEHD